MKNKIYKIHTTFVYIGVGSGAPQRGDPIIIMCMASALARNLRVQSLRCGSWAGPNYRIVGPRPTKGVVRARN